MSTHSLRAGGATTMFHAGYGLLEVKEWGRWKSSCFHGYLWYDMQTMGHVGKKMAVATGLLEFTQIKPSRPKVVNFRASGKESQPQSSLPGKNIIHIEDVSGELLQTIRKAVHLWWLVGNPSMADEQDVGHFLDTSAVFYARQGRKFVQELLALGSFHLARKVVRSYTHRNKNRPQEHPAVEFNRLRRELGRSFFGAPGPQPFRVGPVYKPPTFEEEKWAKYITSERKDQVRRQSEAAIQRVVDMYGTDDFFRIDEMGKSGELTVWLMGRFGATNFTIIHQLLKSGRYGDQKEVNHDGNQYIDLASSSGVRFCQETMTLEEKTALLGGPCIAPPDDDSPLTPHQNGESAGFSASHPDRMGEMVEIWLPLPISREISRGISRKIGCGSQRRG